MSWLAVLMQTARRGFVRVVGLYLVCATLLICPVLSGRSAPPSGAARGGHPLPFALTFLDLCWVGVFERFWFWIFTYAVQYATVMPFSDGMQMWPLGLRRPHGPGFWFLGSGRGIGLVAVVGSGRSQAEPQGCRRRLSSSHSCLRSPPWPRGGPLLCESLLHPDAPGLAILAWCRCWPGLRILRPGPPSGSSWPPCCWSPLPRSSAMRSMPSGPFLLR